MKQNKDPKNGLAPAWANSGSGESLMSLQSPNDGIEHFELHYGDSFLTTVALFPSVTLALIYTVDASITDVMISEAATRNGLKRGRDLPASGSAGATLTLDTRLSAPRTSPKVTQRRDVSYHQSSQSRLRGHYFRSDRVIKCHTD